MIMKTRKQGSKKTRRALLYYSCFPVFLFSCFQLLQAQPVERITGSPYLASKKPDTLFVMDDSKLSADERVAVQSLQGLLAQYKPKIYRVSDDASLLWLQELQSRY